MNREIKFRAWNIARNEMFGWDILTQSKQDHIWTWFEANRNPTHNILMQYIGLKRLMKKGN